MRNSILAAAVLALIAGGAMAQTTTTPSQNGPQNSAVNTDNSSNRQAGAPVKGRNSFTEGEAKSRIEARGFADVSGLKKDDDGVWRGQAKKDGKPVQVSLDYQGNVIAGDNTAGSTTPTDTTKGSSGK